MNTETAPPTLEDYDAAINALGEQIANLNTAVSSVANAIESCEDAGAPLPVMRNLRAARERIVKERLDLRDHREALKVKRDALQAPWKDAFEENDASPAPKESVPSGGSHPTVCDRPCPDGPEVCDPRPVTDEDLEALREELQWLQDDHTARNHPILASDRILFSHGRKYIKIERQRRKKDDDGNPVDLDHGRSVHAFIVKATGDVLKAESWKKPAKHVRGNIFDGGSHGLGVHGAHYMK